MVSLRTRVLSHELMDSPDLPRPDVDAALRGLARLNRLSNAPGILWRAIKPFTRPGDRVSLLDIATGSGDVPIAVARRAARSGVVIDLSLADLRPEMRAAAAQNAASANIPARTLAFDAVRDAIPESCDFITASLFTHHLSDDEVVALLRSAASAARKALVVSDLSRSTPNLAMVWLTSRLVTRSHVVHTDGPLSVRAAFTPKEFASLAEKAGLRGGRIRGAPPCRFVYVWSPGA
ncbi:MAG: methyltransferase domain-containing protein [Phycisphaerales bacterium]